MRYPKRSQYKYAKSRYLVRNWAEYETGLRFARPAADEPIHQLIDSTGLRVHVGHLRKPLKRRVWRKLHLAVNADTSEVLASDLTSRRTADCAQVPELLDQIDNRVVTFMADGAYDTGAVYEAAEEKGGGQRERKSASTPSHSPTALPVRHRSLGPPRIRLEQFPIGNIFCFSVRQNKNIPYRE